MPDLLLMAWETFKVTTVPLMICMYKYITFAIMKLAPILWVNKGLHLILFSQLSNSGDKLSFFK